MTIRTVCMKLVRSGNYLLPLLLIAASAVYEARAAERGESYSIEIEADYGEDLGQNYGSLFQIVDGQGEVVAGAGFEGVFNTTGRGNRRRLSVFTKPVGDHPEFAIKPLPRSTTDAGVYMFDFRNRLYAQSAGGGEDRTPRYWDGSRWRMDREVIPYSTPVGDKVLSISSPRVLYGGRTILDLSKRRLGIARYYYAGGHLFLRVNGDGVNEIAACPWRPSQREIDYDSAPKIQMRSPREFLYAYGQLGDHVLAATNTGGVYRFDGKNWTCLVEPIMTVSYQVYTMINYYDRLLLGQYPTGELFEYNGKELKHLDGQPPVMPGVSGSAREAQTSAIYGGDLYVGVWPWAELWRLDSDTHKWQLVRRMFTHPEITDKQVHPYEAEAKSLGHVLNRWGHRITGLVPFGGALFLSTSSKGSSPYQQSFGFLNDGERWKDYGRVYEMTLPGQVSLDTAWKGGRNTYRVVVTPTTLTVSQQDGEVRQTKITRGVFDAIKSGTLKPREGIYGAYGGKTLQIRAKTH